MRTAQHLFYVSTSDRPRSNDRFNGSGALPASAGLGGGAGAAGSGDQTAGSAVAARPNCDFAPATRSAGGNPVAIQGFLGRGHDPVHSTRRCRSGDLSGSPDLPDRESRPSPSSKPRRGMIMPGIELSLGSFHSSADAEGDRRGPTGPVSITTVRTRSATRSRTSFIPFVGQLIQKLNQTLRWPGCSIPRFPCRGLKSRPTPRLATTRPSQPKADRGSASDGRPPATLDDQSYDLQIPGAPYANYNWELLYHIPVMVGVHLSSNQRFAEAQNWFHLVFDPTSTDTSVPAPQRFWKFLAFRPVMPVPSVQDINDASDPAQHSRQPVSINCPACREAGGC